MRKGLTEAGPTCLRTAVGGLHHLVVGLGAMLVIAAPARSDWVNLTGAETAPNIAEITVLGDRVRVALEIHIGDLTAFKELVPDDWRTQGTSGRPPLAERLRRFSEDGLQVLADGARLQARLERAEPRLRKDRYSPFAGMVHPVTKRRLPEPPKDKRVLYVELDYPFKGRPTTLTFIPPSDASGRRAVTIGFIAYHKAVPVIDFRYLSAAAKLTLDWEDPWYSRFQNPNLKRHHKSALMSFLYVEPREVRHEAMIRVKDLLERTDLGLTDRATLSLADQTRINALAEAYFAARNPVTIDGAPRTPASAEAQFLTISLKGIRAIETPAPLDLSTAVVGVMLRYPVKGLPQTASVRWEIFSAREQRVAGSVIDPAGPLGTFATPADCMIEWRNFLRRYKEPEVAPLMVAQSSAARVPLLSAVLLVLATGLVVLAVRGKLIPRPASAALASISVVSAILLMQVGVVSVRNPFAGPPSAPAAKQIVSDVLTNVAHAFVEVDPAARRSALETVVAKDRIGDMETDITRVNTVAIAGGGTGRVETVADVAVSQIARLEGVPGFRSLAEWSATAAAGHWGHVHRRRFTIRAIVDLAERDGRWMLAGLTLLEMKAAR